MKVVITGAAGFLGSYFLKAFSDEPGVSLWAADRGRGVLPGFHGDNVHWLTGDLCSLAFCREVVRDKDVILHLAQSNFPLDSAKDFAGDIMSSLLPSTNLLQAMVEVGNKPHLIFASSGGAIYGDSDSDRLFSEEESCMPQSAYGIQKLMLEHYIRLLAGRDLISSCILRITNAYGTILPIHRRQGLIGVAMARMMAQKPITIFGSLSNIRDYVHLQDIYDAIRRCLRRREQYEVFNIGTGKGTSVAEVLATLERVTGITAIIDSVASVDDSGLISRCVVNPAKALSVLNWCATIDVEQGIRRMYEEWQQTR